MITALWRKNSKQQATDAVEAWTALGMYYLEIVPHYLGLYRK